MNRIRTGLAGTALAAALSCAVAAPAAAESPTVGISAPTAEPGQELLVTSRGWEPGTLVNLEVCGASGVEGSASCAVTSARPATADEGGEVVEVVDVEIPPAPCPCVVRASGAGLSATVALAIVGAPVGQATLPGAPIAPSLAVESAHLEGSGPWTSWFGAAPVRQLVVRLHNPGDAPVDGAELFVTVGRGDTATRLVPTPRVDPIDAGATVTYRIPVSLGGLAFGSYTTKLEVIGGAEPVVLEERTSAYPWGLAVVFLLLVQLGLLAVRNRLQRRVAREALASLEPIAELPAAEVIDLTDPPPVPVGDAGAGFAMTAAPIADVEAVAAAARRVTDVSLAALARPAATDLDTLDLLRALEDRAAHVLDDVVRQVEALRSELVGACDDIRAEAADRRQRDDDAAAAARHGLAVAMHALDARSAELVEHLDQLGGTRPDEAEVIDLVHPTRAPDPVDEALGRGILRALRS